MKKSLSVAAIIMAAMMLFCVFADAAQMATSYRPSLTFSGTTANCQVIIQSVGAEIDVTLELWKGATLIDSWPGTGTTRVVISGTHSIVRGQTYTLKLSGTIDGENVTMSPVTQTCPN